MSISEKSDPFELTRYYLNFIIQQNESDRRTIEERGQEYISTLKAIRSKIFSGISFVIAFLLAIASMNIMRQETLAASIGLIIIAVACFFIIDVLIRNSSIVFLKIKASRYKPILILTQILDVHITLLVEMNITTEHLRIFLRYLRLVSSLKPELIEEYKKASRTRSLLFERPYYDSMRKTEEILAAQALDYYLNNKDDLVKDEIVPIYESVVARTMGSESVLQEYERLATSRTSVEYKNKKYGIEINFPVGWQLNEPNKKRKKIKRFEIRIVIANPVKEAEQVSFEISILDSDALIQKEKSPNELIDFQLSMMKDDPDITVDSEGDTNIGSFSGHIIVYTNNFRGLVDKEMHLWIISGVIVFQFSFKASNSILFDTYHPVAMDILKTLKFLR